MKLRWAQGQGPGGHGTKYHVIVRDVEDARGWVTSRTACGTTIVQSEEWYDGASRAYLRGYACPRCLAKYPVPAEDVTLDGQPWPGWQRSGTPSPLFPVVQSSELMVESQHV